MKRAGLAFVLILSGNLSFPRDHASHRDARLEWWYVTGHLATESGRRLGYQVTFFRVAVTARDLFLAHFARTDVAARSFRFAERTHRSGVYAAWAREDRLDVANEDWRLLDVGGRFTLLAQDAADQTEVSLLLSPLKPAVLHGENGFSRKGAEPDAVSRYVSFTRLETTGWWTSNGRSERVTGLSWMDHEWGPGVLGTGTAGWDWFGLQLADGRDLMLYRMRPKGNAAPSPFSSGTLVGKDGLATTLSASDFAIEETARWTSRKSGATYPSRWIVRVPKAGLEAEVVPVLPDQELVTEKSTRVTYWEGDCDVRARGAGTLLGHAYVEMTGYAGTGGLGFFR